MRKSSGNFGTKIATFGLDDTEDFIRDVIKSMDDLSGSELQKWAKDDVKTDLESLIINIQDGYKIHGKGANKDIQIDLYENKDGFQVTASGKDLLYMEFGTGQKGFEHPYEDTEALQRLGYKYGGGPNVIQDSSYINREHSLKTLFSGENKMPYWYKKALKEGKVNSNEFVWYGPYGMSKGMAPMAVWYDTWEGAQDADELEEPDASVSKSMTYKKLRMRIEKVLKWDD